MGHRVDAADGANAEWVAALRDVFSGDEVFDGMYAHLFDDGEIQLDGYLKPSQMPKFIALLQQIIALPPAQT
jgi:hypothetical protein